MLLTPAQSATFKTWLLANAAGLSDQDAADLANAAGSPDYWGWRTDVHRLDVYTALPVEGTSWGWTGYKNQAITEQGAWVEMFMGGVCNFSNANNRAGALAIFGTAGAGGANLTHIQNVVRRKLSNIEKLFSTQITGAPANTGNDNVAGNRGKTTNPDTIVWEGPVTSGQVAETRG